MTAVANTRALLALAVLAVFMLGTRYLAGEAHAAPGDEAAFGLGCVLVAAYVGGELAAAIKLPRLTGYLLLGFLLGPGIPDYFGWTPRFLTGQSVKTLQLLDAVAIGIIAFKGGGELQWKLVRQEIKTFAGVLGGHSLGAFLFVGTTAYLLAGPLGFGQLTGAQTVAMALMMGTVAVAKSPATTLAVRAECRARGPVSDTALGVTIIADIVVALLFAVMAGVAAGLAGAHTSGGHGLGHVLIEILGSLAAGAGLGVLMAWVIGKIRHELTAVLLACAVGTMFVAPRLGLSGLLICMVAGFVVENFSTRGHQLIQGLERRTLPIFAVFFAIAGAGISVTQLVAVGPWLLVIPAARMAGIRLGTGLFAKAVAAPVVVQRRIWTGLLGQAGMTLALITAIGNTFPSFGPGLKNLMLGVIAVNQVIGPILFRWAIVASGEEGGADRLADAEVPGVAPAGAHP